MPAAPRALDVLLVSMPFGPVSQPSLGLSLLRGALDGPSCEILYCTFELAEQLGSLANYRFIAEGNPNTTSLVGEWVMSPALFTHAGDEDPNSYIDTVLRPEATVPLPNDFVEDLLTLRRQAPQFIADCVERILARKPSIVGFTSVFQQHVATLAAAKLLKERAPEICILVGGANCEGVMGEETLRQFPFLDAVVSGEGEVIFPQLVDQALAREELSSLPGVLTPRSLESHNGSRLARTPAPATLDALPYPDYTDFLERWHQSPLSTGEKPALLFETSRGCWWGEKQHCTFCGLNGSSMSYRSKSAKRAIDELEAITESSPDSVVLVVDNILDQHYFQTFIPELARRGSKVELFYEIKSNLRRDQLELLYRAGIREIQPGIESLSDRVLTLMRKGNRGLENIRLLRWCKEIGVLPLWNLIWGFPREPPEEYERMAAMIPHLHHLTPPERGLAIRLDRFSPNFDHGEELGLADIRPCTAYSHIYPFAQETRSKLAYYFFHDYADGRNVDDYTADTSQAITDWRRNHHRSELLWQDDGKKLKLWDFRPNAVQPLVVLRGIDRQLYLACDAIASLPRLTDTAREARSDLLASEVETRLRQLVESGYLARDNDRFLALATPFVAS